MRDQMRHQHMMQQHMIGGGLQSPHHSHSPVRHPSMCRGLEDDLPKIPRHLSMGGQAAHSHSPSRHHTPVALGIPCEVPGMSPGSPLMPPGSAHSPAHGRGLCPTFSMGLHDDVHPSMQLPHELCSPALSPSHSPSRRNARSMVQAALNSPSPPLSPKRRNGRGQVASCGSPKMRESNESSALVSEVPGDIDAAHMDLSPEELTTVMLRNLPNNYSRAMLMEMLDSEGFTAQYNFFYLPIDFKSGASLGYAFVNLVSAEAVQRFWRTFNGFSRWVLPSQKICEVTWSTPYQGLAAHVERYRNSPLMHEAVPDEYKPVMLQTGVRAEFPPPTKKVRAPWMRHYKASRGAVRRASEQGSEGTASPAHPTKRFAMGEGGETHTDEEDFWL